ncbi:hypothetical protein [Fulvivirga sp.]|uniref:hypothetical protein n=1 Tax=Fulvivirga sp. TaxID=1931237 RepID=UPI0032EC8044
MELAELKSSWKIADATSEFVDETLISKAIHKKPAGELAKIKWSLHFKFIFGGSAALICTVFTFLSIAYHQKFTPLDTHFSSLETTLFYGSLALSLLIMIWFNYRAYRQIQIVLTQPDSIKSTLKRFIKSMESAIRFNIYSEALMSPIFITWLYYAYVFDNRTFDWDVFGLVLLLLPFAIGAFSYYFQRYAQKLKFGNYLSRLKSYYEGLDEKSFSEKV